jgi:pimeloyl-ACP methyl ester carboxylesterase
LPLRTFLEANGYQAVDVWLSDYISLNDDVRVPDVAKRMHAVIEAALAAGQLTRPFDIIAHSTGGLVAREWLSRFYPDPVTVPVKRIVMLSPANFGSKLAADGKSLIGRVLKGWNNWLQSGQQMLDELELASSYQWELACRDLLNPDGDAAPALYGPGKLWPFVISGTHGYTDGLQPIVNENGSDGTVRPAAANLNVIGMTVDFSADAAAPTVRLWPSRAGAEIPFAILPDRNHGNINQPGLDTGSTASPQLGQLILEALGCASEDGYATIAASWDALTGRTGELADNPAAVAAVFPNSPPDAAIFHQFMQLIVRVVDDDGQPVDDFFLEFFSPDTAGDADTVTFHTQVLADVHTNSLDASMRCLFLDRTNLFEKYYAQLPAGLAKQVALSLSAAAPGADVSYFSDTKVGAEGSLVIHDEDVDARAGLPARFHRNCTHLLEIIIPREPTDGVFSISQPA